MCSSAAVPGSAMCGRAADTARALLRRERPPQGGERLQGIGLCPPPGGGKRGDGHSQHQGRDLRINIRLDFTYNVIKKWSSNMSINELMIEVGSEEIIWASIVAICD